MIDKRFVAATVLLAAFASAQAFYSRPGAVESFASIWQRSTSGQSPTTSPAGAASTLTPPPLTPEENEGRGGSVAYTTPFLPNTTLAAPEEHPQKDSASFPVGRLFKARLLTGVLATPLATTPVMAQSTEGWCGEDECEPLTLLGEASFSPNGRAVVRFTTAVAGNTTYQLNAIAFDPQDRLFGLTGQIMDIAPALAADLLRAAVSGIADWVRALDRQTQTQILQIPGGGQQIISSSEAAPFWAYSLGKVGGVFALPQNTTQIVRALVRSAGDEILVASFNPTRVASSFGGYGSTP